MCGNMYPKNAHRALIKTVPMQNAARMYVKNIATTTTVTDNIFFVNDFVPRATFEERLQQKSKVIWMTGLSGSGKSTLAKALQQKLFEEGKVAVVLDGDNLRHGINSNLGFSEDDRTENVRRTAEMAKILLNSGVIVIVALISPTKKVRALAKEIIGEADFLEVYVNASLEVCEQRDVKGFYKRARNGEIKNFTGVSAKYEVPLKVYLELKTDVVGIDRCLDCLMDKII
jgi:adenylylsulfate kinase